MAGEWYTSDHHFRHTRMATEWRGFPDVDAHDEALIANHNRVVRRDDTVFMLGDVGLGPTDAVLSKVKRLNGRLHLILGNHDRPHPEHRHADRDLAEWLSYGVFETIRAESCRNLAGRKVMLSHFPRTGDHTADERYADWRPAGNRLVVHGHVHKTWRTSADGVHVGLDAWGLVPVPRHQLEALINDTFGPPPPKPPKRSRQGGEHPPP